MSRTDSHGRPLCAGTYAGGKSAARDSGDGMRTTERFVSKPTEAWTSTVTTLKALAAAGFLPDDLTGIIDPLAVEVQRVLLAVKGTEREQELRQAVAFMLKAAA
jgi:hypothetical protein